MAWTYAEGALKQSVPFECHRLQIEGLELLQSELDMTHSVWFDPKT